jgi:protein-tyrosine kinase
VEDLERKGVAMPFLGHIPLIKRKKWEAQDQSAAATHQDVPELGEAFRYIRVAINFSGSPESIKILTFSSCLPHEGKSFVSHNIAISLALDGNRTLLVDADLRRPVVHKRFSADNSVGLSNYLTSNLEFDSVLKESHVENLTLVVAGPVSPNPTEILGSARMKQFLDEARKKFDRIIIDCPPLTGIGDSYVVGSLLGQIVMIIAAGQTPADLIKQNQKQLDKASVKVIGMILNMVDMEKERYGGYYQHYHQTYTRYYRSDPK